MLELQKSFLLVKFFNQVSFNKGLKAKMSCFSCSTPGAGKFKPYKRLLSSWCHIDWRNTKIYIHRASRMEQKHRKYCKLLLFKGKLQVFISYLSEMKTVSMFYNSSFFLILFTACFNFFLFWRYLNSSMTYFSVEILLPFPHLIDLNSHVVFKLHFFMMAFSRFFKNFGDE